MGGAFSGILSQNFHRAGLRTGPFFVLCAGGGGLSARFALGPNAMASPPAHTSPPRRPREGGDPACSFHLAFGAKQAGPSPSRGRRGEVKFTRAASCDRSRPGDHFMHFRTPHPSTRGLHAPNRSEIAPPTRRVAQIAMLPDLFAFAAKVDSGHKELAFQASSPKTFIGLVFGPALFLCSIQAVPLQAESP